MTDTSVIAGGRIPPNQVAGNNYNPIVGGTPAHPVDYPILTPVVVSLVADGQVIPGRANAEDTSSVIGLCAGRAVVGSKVVVQTDGVITATTAEWDEITGQVGGLTRGAAYFLSPGFQEGMLTSTEPSGSGDFVTPVGIALSARDFLIQICCAQAVVLPANG
jgi:hypothetical protein